MVKGVIFRGGFYWRKRSKNWRDMNTGQIIKLPVFATLSELKAATLKGKPIIESEHDNLYGDDRIAMKDAAKRKKIAQDVIIRRKERN